MKKFWCIVPCAGSGSRVGAEIPKQYLNIEGKLIIEKTLSRLAETRILAGIVVVISREDKLWPTVNYPKNVLIESVYGGDFRYQSVLNGINCLLDKGLGSQWVLVHDAARPCVRPQDIKLLVRTVLEKNVGGILAGPSQDTLKLVDENKKIIKTLDRENIFRAYTPQMFNLESLKLAIENCVQAGTSVTDECSAMEFSGASPVLVPGSADNIKITTASDLIVAGNMLKNQKSEGLL